MEYTDKRCHEMKKSISAALAALLMIPAYAVGVSAETELTLPFDLTAPENVSIIYLDGADSENTCEVHYSQNNSMSEWADSMSADYDLSAQKLNEMGYTDIWVKAQIDWSLDAQDDWHYNSYWDTDGYDADYVQHLGDWAYISQSYSEQTSMSEWIFRYMGNIDDPEDKSWYGDHADSDYDGWKDVLKEDQYEIVSDEYGSYPKIDFTKHTLYVRVRWLVTARDMDLDTASDWSEIAAVGKDAERAEPVKEGELAAPVISDLRYIEETFNGYPMIAFKLDVSDTLAKQVAQLTGTQGGISLETEARVQGSSEWTSLQGDWTIKSGELNVALQNLAEAEGGAIEADTPIELRARYYCTQNGQEDFYSDYSEILTFESAEMTKPADQSAADDSTAEAVPNQTDAEGSGKTSSLWWLWLLLLLLVIVIVIVIVILRRKKKQS